MHSSCFRVLCAFGLWLLLSSATHAWEPLVRGGQCAHNGAPCVSTYGGVNSGCCDPSSPSCPTRAVCLGTPLRWAQGAFPLRWYLTLQSIPGTEGFSKLTAAEVEKAIKDAWSSWEIPSCTSFRQIYGGSIQRLPNPRDGVVVMYLATPSEWAQIGFPGEVLAFSNPAAQPSSSTLFDGDIVFNPNPTAAWGASPNITQQNTDLAAVAQHEIGHTLGLGHSQDSTATMFYQLRQSGALFGPLPADDQQAICTMYPANLCQKDQDCGACRRCDAQGRCAEATAPSPSLCKPCNSDTDCGASGLCSQTWQGGRCTYPCGAQGCCPQGYTCQTSQGAKRCIPTTGSCNDALCANDAACGADGACVQNRCTNKLLPQTGLCKRDCSQDNECSGDEACAYFTETIRRCAKRCPDGWCPQGFRCREQAGSHVCTPEDPRLCPCSGDSDCPSGQSCPQGYCQRPDGNQTLEPCSNQVSCRTGMACININQSNRCARLCGPESATSLGNNGMPCYQGFCGSGLKCAEVPNVGPLCMKSCNQDSD